MVLLLSGHFKSIPGRLRPGSLTPDREHDRIKTRSTHRKTSGTVVKTNKYFALVVIIPVFTVFVQAVAFDFLKYDDTINVSENVWILKPTIQHLLAFWEAPFLNLYIPVTYTAWWGLGLLSRTIFSGRLDPGLFHLFNLVIHVFNCVLVYFIIQKFISLKQIDGSDSWIVFAAATGALVFGLHPVQVETVSWITGLKGVLGGFFSLCAVNLFLVYYPTPKRFFVYIAATVFMALAVLSMPLAVCLPGMVFFLMLSVDFRVTAEKIYPLLLWVVIALGVVAITRMAQPMAGRIVDYPWTIRPLVVLDAVMFYLHKIFWPSILAVDYCRTPGHVIGLAWRNPYLWSVIPLAGLLWLGRRRPRWLMLAGAFFAGILPVSGLLPFAFQETSTVADRYVYLSMAVVAIAAANLILVRPRRRVAWICLLLVLILGTKSFYQCRKWENTATIMGHTLVHYPCSFRANLNYGIALMSMGDFKPAIPFIQAALRLRPDTPLAFYNLGLAYAATGETVLFEQQHQKLNALDKQKAARLWRAALAFAHLRASGEGKIEGVFDSGDQKENK